MRTPAVMALKIMVLALVVVSQVFYFKYVIVPDVKATRVKVGQVWEYKCTLPFHEKDIPKLRTVIAVEGGQVKYTIPAPYLPGGVFTWDCSARTFVADSTLKRDK